MEEIESPESIESPEISFSLEYCLSKANQETGPFYCSLTKNMPIQFGKLKMAKKIWNTQALHNLDVPNIRAKFPRFLKFSQSKQMSANPLDKKQTPIAVIFSCRAMVGPVWQSPCRINTWHLTVH